MPTTGGRTPSMKPNPLLVEYICSNCKTLLKSTDTKIDRLAVKEDCPACGTPLSQSLAIRPSRITVNGPILTKQKPLEFVRADNYPRLRFGIPELDSILSPLLEGEMLCISGSSATALLENLCCRSLLPPRAGGLGADHVLYVDAGNTSQVYRFVRLARFYGLDYRDALRRVVQTRTFTIHQLASVVIKELPAVVDSINAKAVFLSDLFELFLREPNLDVKEAESLAAQMARALATVARKHLLIISLTRTSAYDRFLFSSGHASSAVKHLRVMEDKAQHRQSVREQTVSLSVQGRELIPEV